MMKQLSLLLGVLLLGIEGCTYVAAVSERDIPTPTLSFLLSTTEARKYYKTLTAEERGEFQRLMGEAFESEWVDYYLGFYPAGGGSRRIIRQAGGDVEVGGDGYRRANFQGYAFRFKEGGIDVMVSSLPESIRGVIINTPKSDEVPGLQEFLTQLSGRSLKDSFEIAESLEDFLAVPAKLRPITGQKELSQAIAKQAKKALILSHLIKYPHPSLIPY